MEQYVIDITIVSIVLGFAVLGFISGFTGKILPLISWVFSAVIAFYLFPYAAPIVRGWMPSEIVADFLTFLVIFIISLLIFTLISKTISGSVKKSKLGMVDRNLGILLGLIIGLFFLCVLVVGLRFFIPSDQTPQVFASSKFFPWIEMCADSMCTLLPEDSALNPKIKHKQHEGLAKKIREEAAKKLARLEPSSRQKKTNSADDDTVPKDTSGYQKAERSQLNHLIETVS